jgi:hypothetical protein
LAAEFALENKALWETSDAFFCPHDWDVPLTPFRLPSVPPIMIGSVSLFVSERLGRKFAGLRHDDDVTLLP